MSNEPQFTIERISTVTPEVVEAAERLRIRLNSSNQISLTGDEYAEYLKQGLKNPDYYWLMARRTSDSKLIGMASLLIMRLPTNVRTSVENLAVDEEAGSMGIGKALYLEAEKIADANGANTMRCAAFADNGAGTGLAESVGYVLETSLNYYEKAIHEGPRF